VRERAFSRRLGFAGRLAHGYIVNEGLDVFARDGGHSTVAKQRLDVALDAATIGH
jgi:hypothetical protein